MNAPVYVKIKRPAGHEGTPDDFVIRDAVREPWRELNLVTNATAHVAALEAENKRLRPLATFGTACLSEWWTNGSNGGVESERVQGFAETAGLFRRVERHPDGVKCEWCNGEEPCGELTEAGLATKAVEGCLALGREIAGRRP